MHEIFFEILSILYCRKDRFYFLFQLEPAFCDPISHMIAMRGEKRLGLGSCYVLVFATLCLHYKCKARGKRIGLRLLKVPCLYEA